MRRWLLKKFKQAVLLLQISVHQISDGGYVYGCTTCKEQQEMANWYDFGIKPKGKI